MCHGFSGPGVNGMRGYLAERDEDEGALGHARVRDFEAGQADVDVVEEKDVEVERPGAVGDSCRAVAAEFELDGEKAVEQGLRGKIGFECNGGVDEAGLMGESNGIGAVKRGASSDAAEGRKAQSGSGESDLRGTCGAGKICAQADVSRVHGSRVARRAEARRSGRRKVSRKPSVW